MLTLRNDEITLKGARNALLPTLDAYGFYGSSALGGSQSKTARISKQAHPIHRAAFRPWDTALSEKSLQQLGAGQGRGLQHNDTHPQPRTRSRCRSGR